MLRHPLLLHSEQGQPIVLHGELKLGCLKITLRPPVHHLVLGLVLLNSPVVACPYSVKSPAQAVTLHY
jgi:hypothetical protein